VPVCILCEILMIDDNLNPNLYLRGEARGPGIRHRPNTRMNANLENASGASLKFRTSRFCASVVALCAVGSMLTSVGMAILALVIFSPLQGISFKTAIPVLSCLIAAWFAAATSVGLWRLLFSIADNEGLHFRLAPKRSPRESNFRWSEIAGIRHKRFGNNQ